MKIFLLSCLLVVIYQFGWSQPVQCSNVGFEEGTFRGWTRTTGFVADSAQQVIYLAERPESEHLGTGTFGHVITSVSDGFDPIVPQIPKVAPGSQHSVQLGNAAAGGIFFDRLRATLLVSADTPLLIYQFAVILQNPNHKPYQQPAFNLVVRTMAGETIPCGFYQAAASNQAAGFSSFSNSRYGALIYRNWTTNILDLRPYIGQQLLLEVTAHGCTDGGHFGYAYFDARCLHAAITPSSYCAERDTTLTLSAPEGFDHYQWNTGDTTRVIRIRPRRGDQYTVRLHSQSTLNPACSQQLQLEYQVDEFNQSTVQQVTLCAGESYAVGDSIYSKPGTYITQIKRPTSICDSVVITHLTVQPLVGSTQQIILCEGSSLTVGDSIYWAAGTYHTPIKRAAPLCDSVITTHLSFTQIELGAIPDTVVSTGDSILLQAPVAVGNQYTFSWWPTEGLSCPNCSSTWAKPNQTTAYKLTVRIPGQECEVNTQVTVRVPACRVDIPSAFSPNGDGINDRFKIVANPCLHRIKQLTIYNRWGEIIFHRENQLITDQASGWDGRYHGRLVEAGTYAYQVKLELSTGAESRHMGTITVLP